MLTENQTREVARPSERVSSPEYAQDFSDEELILLDNLVYLLTRAEVSQEEKAPKWDELSRSQQQLLVKRYGSAQKISRQVRVVDYTKGEGCADNERGLPFSFDSTNFGIWDKHLLVFALYDSVSQMDLSSKVRIVPSALLIGINGTVLLPDYFYTPSGSLRREILIEQMKRNSRKDKSLRLAEAYIDGALDTDGLLLTIYRRVGSRFSQGDHFKDSEVAREAMQELGLTHLESENRLVRQRQVIEISRRVQQHISEIVSMSNLHLIRQAFEKQENISFLQMQESASLIHFIDAESGEENYLTPSTVIAQNGTFTRVKDPTWMYEDARQPFVYRYEYELKGKREQRYLYIATSHVFVKKDDLISA